MQSRIVDDEANNLADATVQENNTEDADRQDEKEQDSIVHVSKSTDKCCKRRKFQKTV